MSSEEVPFYFEPIRYLVGKTRELTYDEEDFVTASRGELGSDYFFKKVIVKNEDEFETVDVSSELLKAITKSIDFVERKVKNKLDSISSSEILKGLLPSPQVDRLSVRRFIREVPRRFYFHKKSPSIILSVTSDTMYVISKNRNHATTLIADIKSKFEKLNEITRDFGLELLRFLTSQEYQSFILENFEKVKKVDYGKPRNAFEEKVMEMCGSVTSSFISNVNVEFEEPVENFEYDVFIGFTDDVKVVVEPTDYESIKDELHEEKIATETLKSKVILATQDKARRLKARSIVIVNGFPDETFLKLKKIADSRGVSLMNEKDYKIGLPTELWNNLLSTMRGRTLYSYVRASR